MRREVAALDLGGTHVSVGRVDLERARVVEWVRVAVPTDASRDDVLERIAAAALDVGAGVDDVGFAAPGPFDYDNGIAWMGHKLDVLYGVDLRAPLATALGLTPDAVTFLNDADAFVLGEWWAGAGKGHRRLMGVTLGTGVGSGFLVDGNLVHLGPGVPPSGEIHRVEHRGTPVEEHVSRAAVIRRYGDPAIDVDEIAIRARNGDERALAVFRDLGTALGEVLGPRLRAFDATCLVVGGSIANAWDLLSAGLESSLRDLDVPATIVRGALADHAALLGAALHVDRRTTRRGQTDTLWRARIAASARPLYELTVDEARADQAAEEALVRSDSLPVEAVDLQGPVPIRLFRPPTDRPTPLCIWLPGGGWVLDTSAASAPACRRIATETGCVVALVRYRLAPEHPFPAAVDDCAAATRWLLDHATELGLDAGRVAIGGTSAGANLAAAVTLLAREHADIGFTAQVLVYPPLLHGAPLPGDAPFLAAGDVAWCWSHYLADLRDGSNPLASPLLADDLGRLPPALIMTAELDPLREEGERYARELRDAGVPVELVRIDGAPHGFFSQSGVMDAADDAQLLVVEALRAAFGPSRSP